MSLQDLLRGLPLPAAPAAADLFRYGPLLGDDGLGLGGGDRGAVGVADHVRHAAVHDDPGPLGQVGGDHAQGAEVVLAALDHLDPVDAGELGVLAAGVVGGADQGGAQQLVAGLADGLAFAVGLAGLGGLGGQAGEAAELPAVAKRLAWPMVATRAGPPLVARPGRLRARAARSTRW
jgi:hypothetical protein